MTTTTIKKELHKAIDDMGDSGFLKAVYAMFKEYTVTYDGSYKLSASEKAELDEQKKLHTEGKTKSYSVSGVRKIVSGKAKK
jgi:hypothetical protein